MKIKQKGQRALHMAALSVSGIILGLNITSTVNGAEYFEIVNLETDHRPLVVIDDFTTVPPPPTTFVAGAPDTPMGTCPEVLVEIFNRWTNDPTIIDYDLNSGGDEDMPELCQRGFLSPLGPFLNLSLVSNYETDSLSEYYINNDSTTWRALMSAGDTAACAVAFGCNNLVLTYP